MLSKANPPHERRARCWTLILLLCTAMGCSMLEDFTTYDGVDPHGRLAVLPNQITVTELATDEDAWRYDDKDPGHFGTSFTHTVDYETTGNNAGDVAVWSLGNTINDVWGWDEVNADAIGFMYDGLGFLLIDASTEPPHVATQLPFGHTRIYITIVRSGSSLKFYLYEDAARTTLYTPLAGDNPMEITVDESRTFRYIFAVNSYNAGVPGWWQSGVIRDLDLGEDEPPADLDTVPIILGGDMVKGAL